MAIQLPMAPVQPEVEAELSHLAKARIRRCTSAIGASASTITQRSGSAAAMA